MSDPDRSVLRLLDANANRAREALRVLEDAARFILNRADLTAQLKSLRHDLTQILLPFLPGALIQRDTPGDVGTDIKTPAEQSRRMSKPSPSPPASAWAKPFAPSKNS